MHSDYSLMLQRFHADVCRTSWHLTSVLSTVRRTVIRWTSEGWRWMWQRYRNYSHALTIRYDMQVFNVQSKNW